eukprot:3470612-Rhodomonas_salina.1
MSAFVSTSKASQNLASQVSPVVCRTKGQAVTVTNLSNHRCQPGVKIVRKSKNGTAVIPSSSVLEILPPEGSGGGGGKHPPCRPGHSLKMSSAEPVCRASRRDETPRTDHKEKGLVGEREGQGEDENSSKLRAKERPRSARQMSPVSKPIAGGAATFRPPARINSAPSGGL